MLKEMKGKIEQLKIDRADPLGNIYQWLIEGASGSKSSMAKTLDYAIEQLEKRGVDWTAINLLTLKSSLLNLASRLIIFLSL